ncbi:hypothetical protein NRIC_10020 [Enterococcus florum]|uniref:DUF1905 domain-containing protein n=1 Tax=Enterococcus florum TaxID=2480627 RepID=A0A4P5PA58_9ENTE|nr:DUF1905 domain-containing protein [Enterococcus florum]GCF93111.1 hypothetical protein NRIC_10020 [Enterococcus florum]
MGNTFTATIERFEMQGGWHFVPVPETLSEPLGYLAAHFGFIPITANVGDTKWDTSMLPKGDGTYFIALPAKVRSKEKLSLGQEIDTSFEVRTREKKKELF